VDGARGEFLCDFGGFDGWRAFVSIGQEDDHDLLVRVAEQGVAGLHSMRQPKRGVARRGGGGQAVVCGPDLEEEMAANRAQVMAEASRQQLYEQAMKTDYASDVDMSAGGTYAAADVGERRGSTAVCSKCHADLGNGRFCPQCGTAAAAATAKQFCPECGTAADGSALFCPGCGGKVGGLK